MKDKFPIEVIVDGDTYIADRVSDDVFDEFVKNHYYVDVCQLSSWANVKAPTWFSEHYAVSKNGQIIGTAALLFRYIPKTSYTLCYCPRGFIVDYCNTNYVKAMVESSKIVAGWHNAFEIKIDPNVCRADLSGKDFPKKFFNECPSDQIVKSLIDLGLEHRGFNMGLVDAQPRFAMITDIDKNLDDIFNSYDKNARRRTKRAEEYGLSIERYDEDGIDVFSEIMDTTGERNHFFVRDKYYFRKIMSSLGPNDDARLYLVYITYEKLLDAKTKEWEALNKEKKELLNRYNKSEKYLKNYDMDEENKKSIERKLAIIQESIDSIDKKISDSERVLNGELASKVKEGKGDEKIFLSGAIMAFAGDRAYYLYAASSNEYRELYPNYFMQWELMKISREKGCKLYDFGGVSGYTKKEDLKKDEDAGLYKFKKLFGSHLYERIGEFDLVLKPFVRKLVNIAMQVRNFLLAHKI